jgi:hypothetical protein
VALPFLDAGLRAGGVVALSCPAEVTALLCQELGERAVQVRSDPRLSLLGARAPDALAHVRRTAEQAPGGAALRILALVNFGSAPAGWREGLRFESVANRALQGLSVDCLCLYDRRRLPTAVIEAAAATHPFLLHDGAWTPSPAYRDPVDYLPRLPWPREPLEDTAPVLALDDVPGLVALRRQIGRALTARVPDPTSGRTCTWPPPRSPPTPSGTGRVRCRRGCGPTATAWSARSPTPGAPSPTRWPASDRPTAATWACGWPASSGTPSTCSPVPTG